MTTPCAPCATASSWTTTGRRSRADRFPRARVWREGDDVSGEDSDSEDEAPTLAQLIADDLKKAVATSDVNTVKKALENAKKFGQAGTDASATTPEMAPTLTGREHLKFQKVTRTLGSTPSNG